jgi:hypothetical protein
MGGGLYIDAAALVGLDLFTVYRVNGNKASTGDPNIHDPYAVIP